MTTTKVKLVFLNNAWLILNIKTNEVINILYTARCVVSYCNNNKLSVQNKDILAEGFREYLQYN